MRYSWDFMWDGTGKRVPIVWGLLLEIIVC